MDAFLFPFDLGFEPWASRAAILPLLQMGVAKKAKAGPARARRLSGCWRRRRPVRRAARLLSNRSGPAAGSFDEAAPERAALSQARASHVMRGEGRAPPRGAQRGPERSPRRPPPSPSFFGLAPRRRPRRAAADFLYKNV